MRGCRSRRRGYILRVGLCGWHGMAGWERCRRVERGEGSECTAHATLTPDQPSVGARHRAGGEGGVTKLGRWLGKMVTEVLLCPIQIPANTMTRSFN